MPTPRSSGRCCSSTPRHILTDWGDTIVLWALMLTPLGYEGRRLVDTDENSLYWRYVWLLWLPIYIMIYWMPRL